MMSKYNKAWVAAVGVLAQVAVAVADALDKGLIPPSWASWARVLLAVATALGVYGVPNRVAAGRNWGLAGDGRHELGRDEGRARPVVLFTVAVLAITALGVVPASAHRPDLEPVAAPAPAVHAGSVHHHRRSPLLKLVPKVSGVAPCQGVLIVVFDVSLHRGTETWQVLDNGGARLEVWDLSGRSWPGGMWITASGVTGWENHLKWPGWATAGNQGLHLMKVRVVVGAATSKPVDIDVKECAA